MENYLVVEYDKNNKKKLFKFLKLGNFRWASGRVFDDEEHCFPFCIDIERRVVYMTNIYFLNEYKRQGYKRISVSDFIKKVL